MSPSAPNRPRAQLTERDVRLLAFLAEHRVALADQIAVLLGCARSTASGRLRVLEQAGYLTQERRIHRRPAWVQITRAGLAAAHSSLPVPRAAQVDAVRHDTGLGWVWLAAQRGAFGPVRELVSERRMRSLDRRGDRDGARLGVRIAGVGPGGGERLHYPDLLLVTPAGKRIAVELELSGKSARRREQILMAYAGDPAIAAVVYLVPDRAIGDAIVATARRVGASGLVDVQRVRWGDPTRPPAPRRQAERGHGRPESGGRER